MKTIIFIRGNQGSGKHIISDLIPNSKHCLTISEVHVATDLPFSFGSIENIIFTSFDIGSYAVTAKRLKDIAKQSKRSYIELSSETFLRYDEYQKTT